MLNLILFVFNLLFINVFVAYAVLHHLDILQLKHVVEKQKKNLYNCKHENIS